MTKERFIVYVKVDLVRIAMEIVFLRGTNFKVGVIFN